MTTLLEKERIWVNEGSMYGEADEGFIRINIACPRQVLMERIQVLADFVKQIAGQKGISTAQVALSWLLYQKPWIASIPGTRSLNHLEDNLGATEVEFTTEEMSEMNEKLSMISAQGARYPKAIEARVGK